MDFPQPPDMNIRKQPGRFSKFGQILLEFLPRLFIRPEHIHEHHGDITALGAGGLLQGVISTLWLGANWRETVSVFPGRTHHPISSLNSSQMFSTHIRNSFSTGDRFFRSSLQHEAHVVQNSQDVHTSKRLIKYSGAELFVSFFFGKIGNFKGAMESTLFV